jgi:hypothetical protein
MRECRTCIRHFGRIANKKWYAGKEG